MIEPVAKARQQLGLPAAPSAIAVGNQWIGGQGAELVVTSPIDGRELISLTMAAPEQIDDVADRAQSAFRQWRLVPAPVRGELVRQIGQRLRQHKEDLATLVTWEAGKIVQESLGEVQEMIDICDFAVGLSRQLYGKTIASERPRTPIDRTMAPARPDWRDHRL